MSGPQDSAARASAGRVGLWLIGAGGNVATTVALGLAALQRGGGASPIGLVTELPVFRAAGLAPLGDLVVGGHELDPGSPLELARALARGDRLFSESLVESLAPALDRFAQRIRPGVGELPAGARDGAARLAAIRRDLAEFARDHDVDRLVVVNLASTEAPHPGPLAAEPEELREAISRGEPTPASVLYAFAALDAGHAYVNFTPSTGASLPALEALARQRGAVHAGRDGKTGETLIKSVLAPMFAARNLRVESWFGQNILGNRDGQTLADPRVRESKTRAKGGLLPEILGYAPAAHVGIDYVAPLGDWKVAWDHIQFEGFLGARMSVQVTWQGADSILAAPLVIDLARLVDRAMRRGEVGALAYLASFFKDPVACQVHGFEAQVALLLEHLGRG